MAESVPAPRETHLARRVTQLAKGMPGIEDLTPAQVDKLAQAVVVDELKAELRRAIVAERVDWQAEREAFLSDARSPHTREAYARALDRLGAWLELHALPASNLTPRLADDFIRDLRAQSGRDADSTRLVVSACSSFFGFLERRFDEIRNPFRGTRARPATTWKVATIPTASETAEIRAAADPQTRAALEVIVSTGLRIGGLPELVIREDLSYYTTSKGKRFLGPEPVSEQVRKAIRAAGLDPRRPFSPETFPLEESARRAEGPVRADHVVAILKMRLARTCQALQLEGKIGAVYSWHDFRHAFAQANVGRGMQWLKAALGHSSIAITEHYLQNTLALDTGKM